MLETVLAKYPWRTRSGLLALIDSLVGVLLVLGFGTDDVNSWVSLAGLVIGVLVNLGIVKEGEQQTTPLSNPRDNTGRRLVPETRE